MISKLEENIWVLDERTWKCTSLANEIDGSMWDMESRLNELLVHAPEEDKTNKRVKEIMERQARDIAKDMNLIEWWIEIIEQSKT